MLSNAMDIGNLNPSIMQPMSSLTLVKDELLDAMKADTSENEFNSIQFNEFDSELQHHHQTYQNGNLNTKLAFSLMGRDESLLIQNEVDFIKRLGCSEDDRIKVVSIFGNTGDGKSYTMNHTFFNGKQVFKTSPEQLSCTIGVTAAMQHEMSVLCLDTEGFLGTTSNPDKRTRMLLKILAISDIIIFRTRAERITRDVYEFLSNASQAFTLHFATALQSLDLPDSPCALGPAVIIFHETRNTNPLQGTIDESIEHKLRGHFSKLNMPIDAFSSIRYNGLKTGDSMSTDFTGLINLIKNEISNKSVRSPRQPGVVFKALKSLNIKYSGEVKHINIFPEQYFTCGLTCESCAKRCQRSMGHLGDGEDHENSDLCIYQFQLDNKVYLCKKCHINGKKVIVNSRLQGNNESSWSGIAIYAWKGAVIECPNCGEIYRSRQYWYGNKSPEDIAVRPEIVHVWKGGNVRDKYELHSGQIILDSVNFISGAISNVVQQPKQALTNWVADKTAPSYWVPNSEIIVCESCRQNFDKKGLQKHHCRNCGKGFCNSCSQHKMPVPGRGWSEDVRVCNHCRQQLLKINKSIGSNQSIDESDITVRKYGETVINVITQVAGVLEYPKDLIKDTVRPTYWAKDSDSPNCSICKRLFGTAEELEIARTLALTAGGGTLQTPKIHPTDLNNGVEHLQSNGDCWRHHCRGCGEAVCDDCSKNRRPVPERSWQCDVRVCDVCFKSKTD